jgi:hypothetical protein
VSALANFPFKNQNLTTLSDGTKDPNEPFDCVPESIAAGLQYYLGRNFSGGVLKEIAYGRDYQGGTAARAYVQYCAQVGIHLYPIDGNTTDLLVLAHGHIRAGHPVVFTEIDPYVDVRLPQWQGATHVCVWYAESPGQLVAMDPFIADAITRSDTDWQQILQENEIWIMERIQENKPMAISLSTPVVGTYYKQGGNSGAWQCIIAGHNFQVGGAILNYYRMLGGAGLCGLTILGLPTSGEIKLNVKDHPEIVTQHFERGDVNYDPHHVVDNPPGAGTVYTTHIEVAAVDTTQISTLQSQLADAQRKLVQIEALAK